MFQVYIKQMEELKYKTNKLTSLALCALQPYTDQNASNTTAANEKHY